MQSIFGGFHGGRVGWALLVLRLVVGIAFVFHGWPKVQDVAGFAGRFDLPLWFGFAAAWTEFLGGLLLVLGLFTPAAAFLLLVQMSVTFGLVHIPMGVPFINPTGASFETAVVYLGVMLAFLLAGPGRYSLDAMLAEGLETGRAPAPSRRRGLA